MKTKLVPIVCAAAIAIIIPSRAVGSPHSDSTATAMDALVGRPLGFAATVVGSAIFVVTLPFSATSGSIKSTAEALVLKPGRDTFVRPLGDLNYHNYPYEKNVTGKHRPTKKARS